MLVRYTEHLEDTELAFLRRREVRERKVYYKVISGLMVMSFIFPFVTAWYRAYDGAPNAFSVLRFFVSTIVLLTICSVATYAAYRFNLRKIQLDIREQTKTIETWPIRRKLHVTGHNTYHFYIDSSVKLSIEVSADDFERLREGDEVSIEYTTHSRQYLGYF